MPEAPPRRRSTWTNVPRPFWGLLATIEVVSIYTQQGLAWAVAIPVAGITCGLIIHWWMIQHGKLDAPDT